MTDHKKFPWNQGEKEAEAAGNPYAWNTPEWHIWNEGRAAALAEMSRVLSQRQERHRNREPRLKYTQERIK